MSLTDKGQLLAVWIFQDAAKLFLGLETLPATVRWVVIGKVEEVDGNGIWLSIDSLEERKFDLKPSDPIPTWIVTPKVSLIKWQFIITIQHLGGKKPDRIGFHRSDPNSVPK
jgi:hypothetical protein